MALRQCGSRSSVCFTSALAIVRNPIFRFIRYFGLTGKEFEMAPGIASGSADWLRARPVVVSQLVQKLEENKTPCCSDLWFRNRRTSSYHTASF